MKIPKGLETFKAPSVESMLSGHYITLQGQIDEALEVKNKSNQEKLAREKKLVEEMEYTRQLIEEFKAIVQEFIIASEAQTKATEENNRVIKNWTERIGWLTLAMVIFAALTLCFNLINLINLL